MPGSNGQMVNGYETRILDGQGQEVAPASPDKLYIRGDSTAKYYLEQSGQRSRDHDGRELAQHRQHLIIRTSRATFIYCGHNDDMLKVGGIWCSPFEIKAKVIEHPRVLETMVVGQTDENGLVKPAAYIVLKNAAEAGDKLHDDLLQLCKKAWLPTNIHAG